MKTYKIVKVEWEDSVNCRGWRDLGQFRTIGCGPCVSSGILVRTQKGTVGVSHTVGENEIADTMIISRKAIKKIEVLGTFKA